MTLHSFKIQGDDVFESVQMPTATIIGNKAVINSTCWSFEDFGANNDVIRKIEGNSIQLSDISKIMRGFEIGRNKVFTEGDYEIITGSDVSKWIINKKSFIKQDTLNEFIKDDFYFDGERVLIRETGSTLTVLYVSEKLYCNRSLYSIKITDNKYDVIYICALLNSKLFQFYYNAKFKSDTDLFPKIRIAQVKQLPVKSSKFQEEVVEMAKQIINQKKKHGDVDVSILQDKIELQIFKTYGLTYEEVLIIDQEFPYNKVIYQEG